MISEPVLLDTGPLVALLHKQDDNHKLCVAQASEISGQVHTTWPVVTEAAWLLRRISGGLEKLLNAISDRDIVCHHVEPVAIPWLVEAAKQYRDLAPQIADLTLVYLADQLGIQHIFTLDRRDFAVYRRADDQSFVLLP